MSKELNDLVIRDRELSELLDIYRYYAKIPDGLLTYEVRHKIVVSLQEERHDIWHEIVELTMEKSDG